jgi:flavin reductase (DIM6/NTAB) family NADH-FMN oxidoreductase RutF
MRTAVPLEKSYLLLNHGPTVMISAKHAGKINVMSAAWVMPIDFDPPKVAIVVGGDTTTRGLISESREFVLNIPSSEQADLAFTVGRTSGAEIDKFEKFGIKTFAGSKVGVPLLEGCLGWLECRVIPEPRMAKEYDLILGEVLAAWVEKELFGEEGWKFDPKGKATLHHLGSGRFAVPSRTLTAAKLR